MAERAPPSNSNVKSIRSTRKINKYCHNQKMVEQRIIIRYVSSILCLDRNICFSRRFALKREDYLQCRLSNIKLWSILL